MNAMKTSLVACGVALAGLMFGPGAQKAEAQCWGGPAYYGGYYGGYYAPQVIAPAPVVIGSPVYCPPVAYPVYGYPRYYRSYGYRAYPQPYARRGFGFGFQYNY